MKVPYPSVSGDLALNPHMYICKNVNAPKYEFVKCQTLKPYMLYRNTMKHYCDEQPDLTRNPFQRATRIDCDKLFTTSSVEYSDGLKTTTRPDVCDDLFYDIVLELNADGFDVISVDEDKLRSLNSLIKAV